MIGDCWPWKRKDGVDASGAQCWQADDASVFDRGEAGGGADGACVAGRDRDDAWGGSPGRAAARLWRRVGAVLGQQADSDDAAVPGVTSGEADRVKDLEQEVRELRRASEVLKRAAVFFGAGLDRRER